MYIFKNLLLNATVSIGNMEIKSQKRCRLQLKIVYECQIVFKDEQICEC